MNLERLITVEVTKDIVPHRARQRLNTTIIHIEVFLPHPEDNVIDADCGIRADDSCVIGQQRSAESERRTRKLNRVQACIRPNQNLTPCSKSRDDLGALRQADISRRICRRRRPVGSVLLIREADQ